MDVTDTYPWHFLSFTSIHNLVDTWTEEAFIGGFVSLSEHRNLNSWTWIIGKSPDIQVTTSKCYPSYNSARLCSSKSQFRVITFFPKEKRVEPGRSWWLALIQTGEEKCQQPDIQYILQVQPNVIFDLR